MTRLTAAVVGLGVGEAHARALAGAAACDVRWLFDLDVPKARRLAGEIGARAAEDYEEVLADTEVDLVCIASHDDAHFGQVARALRSGKHVFVEKPLCRSLDELREVKALAEAARRRVASNLVLRSAPLYQWLRGAVRAGRFGRIYAFDGDYLYGRFHKITHGWRRDVLNYSVMQGGGIHLVDLMLWLSGERPTTVYTTGNRIASSGTGFRYDDLAAATFNFGSTMVGRVTANFASAQPHQHVVRIFGTSATFTYDDQGARLHTSRDPSVVPERVASDPLPASKGDLAVGFAADLLAGTDRAAAMQHEFDVIAVCVAADRSRAERREVLIEYV